MAGRTFKNLDDYEHFIETAIAPWSAERRMVLAAAMAERWLPAYGEFSEEEEWGDPAILRQALDQVWNQVEGIHSPRVNWPALKKQVQEITPHMDDFDANEAMCACVMVQYALGCCSERSNQSSALMAVLSGLEAVLPDILDDEPLPAGTWKQPTLRREIEKQLNLVEEVSLLAEVAGARQALEAFLTDPRMVGELGASRTEEQIPSGPTNQQAFEQYQKIIQMDIKGASSGLDPRKYPELATTLYLGAWMGRYSRRKQIIAGEYGRLIDEAAITRLVAMNRARDLAEPGQAAWDEAAGQTIELFYQNAHNGMDAATPESPHGYGPSLRRLWLEAKSRGLSDQRTWESVEEWAYHQPEAWDRKGKKTSASLQRMLEQPLTWETTGDPFMPWTAKVDEALWQVRLNDFPDEVMYSLMVNGEETGDFHEWPGVWKRD